MDPGAEGESSGEPVSQARVLDEGLERPMPGYGEVDYQRHRNVYVGLHIPHSHSRHKGHRHKRKHSRHGSNGHHRDSSGNHRDGNGNHRDGNGGGTSSENVDGHQTHEPLEEVDSVAGVSGTQRGVASRGSDVTGLTSGQENLLGQPRYKKSHSLPAGHFFIGEPPRRTTHEPKTPSDPCDRVKFILGGDHDDATDHHDSSTTHSVFTELEELKFDEHEQKMEWKETARWIKFEEDVEEGGNKWSKPFVGTLSLHSLFELRSCIFKGTVLLDLQADNLAAISDIVLDNLVSTGQLEEESREKVRAALLQRHHHLNSKKEGDKKLLEHIRSLSEIARHGSRDFDAVVAAGSGGNMFGSRNGSRRGSIMTNDGTGTRNGSIKEDDEEYDTVHTRKPDSNFMKKLPPGSEASNVLVGEVDFLSHPIIAFVRLARGQYLDITEVPIPTRFIFIMLGPTGNQERYHEIGRSISTLMSDEVFHEVAYKARNRGDLLAGVDEFLDKVTILPPGEWDPQIRLEPPSKIPSQAPRKNTVDITKQSVDVPAEPYKCKHCKTVMDHPEPIKWTKRPFRGLLRDMTTCYNVYRSDFSEAFSLQVVASLILIYFANITLAFTFGAILSNQTNSTLGATETILAVGIGNFIYSIFSGQPLVILGPTGPTIIFEQLIFAFCSMQSLPFLEFRFWIGMWTAIFMFLLVIFNVSAVTRLFTRFTEEIFTVLISLIFIYLAFEALWNIHITFPYNEWITYPTQRRECDCFEFPSLGSLMASNTSNATNLGTFWSDPNRNCSRSLWRKYLGDECPPGLVVHGDVFLMSVILFFGTFLFCVYFKKIKNSKVFKSYIRYLFSDFGVFISVVVWVVVDVLAQVETPKLKVPNVFERGVYSSENRTFVIDPLGHDLPSWAPAAAIIPALLATILFFMDQHITAIIVNRKDNKLKKHPGYHLDLFLIGCLIFLHSLLGLPWVVGATILSISHVQSLHVYSASAAPGERPKFIGVREQRVTLFFMAILVGISVMAYKVLELLPLPVLYGLVLYLGVASLYGVQFLQRFKLFFIPNKHKHDYECLRHIPNRTIYVYTVIQCVFVVVLFIIYGAFPASYFVRVTLPLAIVALVISRWLFGFCFSKHDLELLDDPLPDALYCRPCRGQHGSSKPLQLQGNTSVDTLGSSTQCSAQDVAVTLEPMAEHSHICARPEDSFNITHEVDQCDLWKNMVKSLDAPLQSPQSFSTSHVQADHTPQPYSDGAWHHSVAMDTNRTLGTLEECDTELESQTPLTDLTSPLTMPSPRFGGVAPPPKYTQLETHKPGTNPSYHRPKVLAYQSTSV